jgi:hypothetical protein
MDWVKQKMYQARLQRNRVNIKEALNHPGDSFATDTAVVTSRLSGLPDSPRRLFWLAGGLVLGSMIVFMLWWSGSVEEVDVSRVSDPASGVSGQNRRAVDPALQHSTLDQLQEDLDLLTQQVQSLTASVSELRVKLLSTRTAGDSIAATPRQPVPMPQDQASPEMLPPPAAGYRDASAREVAVAGRSEDMTGDTAPARQQVATSASGAQAPERHADTGPWVINLVSLPRRADAERFMKNAESRGVKTGMYQATVSGKSYWRVHVAGFSTAADARDKAGVIKEQLELGDVWITRR